MGGGVQTSDGPEEGGGATGPNRFEPGAGDLSDLLQCCRELSNILETDGLYAALSKILVERFGVDTLCVFAYRDEPECFELAFDRGGGARVHRIRPNELPFQRELFPNRFPVEPMSATGPGGATHVTDAGFLGLGAVLWLPLVMRREVIGLLALGPLADRRPLEATDRYFLGQIASHAAVCINTCRLYAQRQKEKEGLDKTLQNLSLLYNIGKAINYISDLKKLLQYILSQAIEITAAEKGSIMLYDMETDRLNIRVLAGIADTAYQERVNNNEVRCRSFRPGEGIAGRVFLTARPLVVNDTREDELFVGSDSSFVRSIACIPMVIYSETIGVINLTNKRHAAGFTEQDVHMLKAVADQAAVAVNKAQLWDMAVTDSLTGLYVRRYFMVKLQEEIHRAERYNKVLSVIMADLDHFKAVNDTYGHPAGDRVLEAIGKYLRKSIRDVDILARYGGEEFVFLLPDTDKDAAFCLAERLRAGLERLPVNGLPTPTLSLGIASYPSDATRLDEIIRLADAALYEAKQAGRNVTVRYSPLITTVPESLQTDRT
jgi:diguanylate cyclase (GGDEF)-like protein